MRMRSYRRLIPLVLLLACGKSQVPADGQAVAESAAASAPVADTAAAEQLHFNSIIAGFDFDIPQSWERRYTVSERAEPDEFPKARHLVEFMYLPDEGDQPPTMLAVLVYAASDWNAVRGSSAGEVVAKKDGLVWVALPAGKDTLFKPGSADAQRFEARRVTIEQVKQGISLH
jgi:hypothetical protein